MDQANDFPVGVRLLLQQPGGKLNQVALEAIDAATLGEILEMMRATAGLEMELVALRGELRASELGFAANDNYIEHCQCSAFDWCTHSLTPSEG